MYTSHYRQGIQTAHNHTSDSERKSDQLLYPADDSIFNRDKYWSDDGIGQISCCKHTNQRCYKQIKHGRNHFVKFFLDDTHHKYGNNHRNHMPLIAHQVYLIQSKPHALGLLYTFRRHRPCILQIRVDHQHTDDSAQIGIAAKDFRRAIGDQDRQEHISGIGKQIGKYKDGARGVDIQEPIIHHKVQSFHNTHQKTAGYDGWDNRNKDISQGLDRPLIDGLFGSCSRFGILFAGRRQTRDGKKLVVHFVDGSRSQDNLKLTRRTEHAFYPVDVLHCFCVTLVIIHQHKP